MLFRSSEFVVGSPRVVVDAANHYVVGWDEVCVLVKDVSDPEVDLMHVNGLQMENSVSEVPAGEA